MKDDVPELWWSPSFGIVTANGDGVWRYNNESWTTLRHDGHPNQLPFDAVRLKSDSIDTVVSPAHVAAVADVLREDLSAYTYDEKIRIITKVAMQLGLEVEEEL